jgi:hypothetical protein
MGQKIRGSIYPLARTGPWSRATTTTGALVHPAFRRLPAPAIVVGMHRSGTSLVAASLSLLGVFFGSEVAAVAGSGECPNEDQLRSGYGEAADFYLLNELLLARAGATWMSVEPFLARRGSTDFAEDSRLVLQLATFLQLRTGYLRGAGAGFSGSWGWKDPRNSLTLPLWEQLFPEARIIHVRRDPEAAAESLHRRARYLSGRCDPAGTAKRDVPLGFRAEWALGNPAACCRRLWARLCGGSGTSAPPDPCLDRDFCSVLAARYVEQCDRYRDRGERYLEVSFEEFLADAPSIARRLADHVGCEVSCRGLDRVSRLIRSG